MGLNNTVMLYDYQDKKQIYSLDSKLDSPATSIQWMESIAFKMTTTRLRFSAVVLFCCGMHPVRKTHSIKQMQTSLFFIFCHLISYTLPHHMKWEAKSPLSFRSLFPNKIAALPFPHNTSADAREYC